MHFPRTYVENREHSNISDAKQVVWLEHVETELAGHAQLGSDVRDIVHQNISACESKKRLLYVMTVLASLLPCTIPPASISCAV